MTIGSMMNAMRDPAGVPGAPVSKVDRFRDCVICAGVDGHFCYAWSTYSGSAHASGFTRSDRGRYSQALSTRSSRSWRELSDDRWTPARWIPRAHPPGYENVHCRCNRTSAYLKDGAAMGHSSSFAVGYRELAPKTEDVRDIGGRDFGKAGMGNSAETEPSTATPHSSRWT